MVLRLWLENGVRNDPLLINQKRSPVGAVVLLAHELLQAPDPKRFVHRQIFIRQQLNRQAVLFGEFDVARHRIWADAQDGNASSFEGREVVTEVAGLGGAAGGHVFRVEIQGELAAGVVGEAADAAVLDGAAEGGRVGAGGEGGGLHGVWSEGFECLQSATNQTRFLFAFPPPPS